MSRTVQEESLADLEFRLTWSSTEAHHEERLHGPRANLWRDILPPGMANALFGRRPGEWVNLPFPPGTLAPAFDPDGQVPVRRHPFHGGRVPGNPVPRFGRFYPAGLAAEGLSARGFPAVLPEAMMPMRVIGVEDGWFTADLNAPLAGVDLRLSAVAHAVAPLGRDMGGKVGDWPRRLITGPGMQARHRGRPTDFGGPEGYRRQDETPDTTFYASPRMTAHVDAACQGRAEALYGEIVPRGGRVLDLMAGRHSHLPAGHAGSVTGVGLNPDEMRENPAIDDHAVHDLNADTRLPFDTGTFDTVLCSFSVEYLTAPATVLAEAVRVLGPGAPLVLTVSHRWFPPKVIRLWPELHPFERLGAMLHWLLEAGGLEGLETRTVHGLPRPEDDRYFPDVPEADPLFAAWGYKAG